MTRNRRALFTLTILVGSFLLFLVQPMVARMALPRLGGAPNVWNSAMLVYQALLLAGYAYAHALGRLSLRAQAWTHLAVLVLAGLTLPIALADLPPPAPGREVLWVPLLFLATIGPLFFAVSAQAPLIQRWFAADPQAGNPYPLYAASNLGSFAGLIAYPLLVEPLVPLRGQSWLWAAGYGLLVALVFLVGRMNAGAIEQPTSQPADGEITAAHPGWRRIALWLALAAVPSGLMLSSTTFLTTDIVAMPLLWVIPLGIYLLSFSVAFSERRGLAEFVARHSAVVVLVLGGVTLLLSNGQGTVLPAAASLLLLAVVAVALHARLYAKRPDPAHLTLFYLVMAAGGALGGAFTALVAPLVFDWSWEHPLLIVAAALLVPRPVFASWSDHLPIAPQRRAMVLALVAAAALVAISFVARTFAAEPLSVPGVIVLAALAMILIVLVVRWRPVFAGLLAVLMLSLGGMGQLRATLDGDRSRSYFGIYTVGERTARFPVGPNRSDVQKVRTLAHGTTLHGLQRRAPGHELEPTTYYGRTSGIGLVLGSADRLLGPGAHVGIVGLGVGTLACYRKPGQAWTFYDIDPAVLDYSQDGTFTFLRQCTPDAPVVIGDARIKLGSARPGAYDLLAIDAFSSDSVPLHLLTTEAFAVYRRALAPDGILMVHISNRFIDLEPAMAAAARAGGMTAAVRLDKKVEYPLTPSIWIAMARSPLQIARLRALSAAEWKPLAAPAQAAWTDDYASVLTAIKWRSLR